MNKFVEVSSSDCMVIEAKEFSRAKSDSLRQPTLVFHHGKTNYRITDRKILYTLLKRLDPELRYLDMMQTLYEVSIEDRPSMGDIIQGYLHHTNKTIGMWVKEGDDERWSEVVLVESIGNQSRYFETTMEYIGANFFPNYKRTTRWMKAGSRKFSYPVMVFSKDDIRIEILSRNQGTYIAGRYNACLYEECRESMWVQPRPVAFCPRWAHLIPHDSLSKMLEDFRVLDSMDELTKDSTLVGGGGVSPRLKIWGERNSLESENMYRFDRKTIQAINSFCNVEE